MIWASYQKDIEERESVEQIDPIQKFDQYAEETYGQAKFILASIVAPITSVLAATTWALVSYAAHAQIGYMAIGVGLLVGGAVRLFCNPVGKSFALTATMYSFLGVLLGNLWAIGLFSTKGTDLRFFQIITSMDYYSALVYHIRNLDGHDFAFYGLSIGAAFKLSYVRLKHDELDFMLKEKGIVIQENGNGLKKRRR